MPREFFSAARVTVRSVSSFDAPSSSLRARSLCCFASSEAASRATYGDAPGYRDVSVIARIGQTGNTQVELRLTPEDGETLMQHITRAPGATPTAVRWT